MSNFLDYLSWRGDLSLRLDRFNEVDNLVLAELSYADLADIVPPPGGGSVSLREAAEAYFRLGRDQSHMNNDPRRLLMKAADSERFGHSRLSAYVNEIDTDRQLQFSALCAELDDGSVYVAYRGTDNSLVGWREDFNLSYLSETPGQLQAVKYLDAAAARSARPLRVGGHSKGGNLAVYAAAFCSPAARERLLAVYSNDGPGFNRAVAERPELAECRRLLCKIVPEGSVVGLLLSSREDRQVIKSSGEGMQQHSPYTWQVEGRSFVRAERLSPSSVLLDEVLDRWAEQLDDAQRENLVNAIFGSLEATGLKTTTEINANKLTSYNAVLRAVRELDPALHRDVVETMKKLAAVGKDVLWNEARRSFVGLVTEPMHRLREAEQSRD